MDSLTPREIEIVRLVAKGFRNKEIADALCITNKTVRNHISHILRKLGLHCCSQIVGYVYEHGLINLE